MQTRDEVECLHNCRESPNASSKFHSLEVRKAKVRLSELVLAFGSFKFLLFPRLSMLYTLLKGNVKSVI